MVEAKKAEDEAEEKILQFWKKNKIYDKVKKRNSKGKKFYFMDGPPYANGHIHMGTALNKTLKDMAMRSKRLQGYDVFDRPGYDTHGLPIEFQVEKEIGSQSKQDIEKFGVKNFVEKCKEYATKYIESMNGEFINLGVWMDWDNPYLTLNDSYIEAVWHAFKEADKKKLLYLGKYPVHLCPRCETAVAYNEIEYRKQEDNSVYVKFPLKNKKNTHLIIWSTTPWTFPANTGVMVNPEIDYQEIELSNGERWIIASKLVPKIMEMCKTNYTVKEEFKGKKMEGWTYENPLSKNLNLKVKNGYKVILSGRYVTTEEGTGLVHCAPGHGKEDYEVGKEYGLDMPSPVNLDGRLTEETGKYSGKKARQVDKEIIEDLEKDGFLVKSQKYSHDYPICWRCKTSLLMVARPQWFLKISEIHAKLLKENNEANWVPDYMKLRMKAWLEGISDWPISRERYWGTPLPIWLCDKCDSKKVVGDLDELRKLSGIKKIDLHKPGIDLVTFKCKCGGKMTRVSSVLDVWFDAGVSSWAALGHPSEKEKFKKYWPADLNLEGKDQFRGWWNSQLILSTISFGKKPFDNVVVHGMVLDVNKKKMSKSQGNIVSPADVIHKFSRDYMRYYFAKLSKGEDFSYDEREFKEIGNVLRVLTNINTFINQVGKGKTEINIEDKWIISKFNSTIKKVVESFNNYRFYEAINELESFLVKNLSRTYVQIIRDRAEETSDVLGEIRIGVLKLFAPLIPFITEKLWQELRDKKIVKEESVHLSSWPKADAKKINTKLEDEFENMMKIIELGLRERDQKQIGLKWPLAKALIISPIAVEKKLQEIVARQLNVKEVDIKEGKELSISLDTKLTPELEAEGFSREIARRIQAERKNRGMNKEERIDLKLVVSNKLKHSLAGFIGFLKERTGTVKIEFTDDKNDKFVSFKVKNEHVFFHF